MSTKSYVFKPDANTLLPLMFDVKLQLALFRSTDLCCGYKKWYGIAWERVIEGFCTGN